MDTLPFERRFDRAREAAYLGAIRRGLLFWLWAPRSWLVPSGRIGPIPLKPGRLSE